MAMEGHGANADLRLQRMNSDPGLGAQGRIHAAVGVDGQLRPSPPRLPRTHQSSPRSAASSTAFSPMHDEQQSRETSPASTSAKMEADDMSSSQASQHRGYPGRRFNEIRAERVPSAQVMPTYDASRADTANARNRTFTSQLPHRSSARALSPVNAGSRQASDGASPMRSEFFPAGPVDLAAARSLQQRRMRNPDLHLPGLLPGRGRLDSNSSIRALGSPEAASQFPSARSLRTDGSAQSPLTLYSESNLDGADGTERTILRSPPPLVSHDSNQQDERDSWRRLMHQRRPSMPPGSNNGSPHRKGTRRSLSNVQDLMLTRTPSMDSVPSDSPLPGAYTPGPIPPPLAELEMVEEVDGGAFGIVYSAYDPLSGAHVAVKRVRIDVDHDKQRRIRDELHVMRTYRHDNLVRYLHFRADDEAGHLDIFMEFVSGGSVGALVKSLWKDGEKTLRPVVTLLYTRQVLSGLSYLHAHKVLHGDIKGGNILRTVNGVCKLADFGCSKVLDGPGSAALEMSVRSLRGSVPFMAPEIVKNQGCVLLSDMWSLGATVLEMASGQIPWSGAGRREVVMYQVAQDALPPIPSAVCGPVRDLILACLRPEPTDRPTPADLLRHPALAPGALERFEAAQRGADHAVAVPPTALRMRRGSSFSSGGSSGSSALMDF